MSKKTLSISLLLITSIFVLRLLPHPANIAPVAAVALVSGLYLEGKYRVLIPLVGLFLSDILIGFYHLPVMFAVYGSFALSFILGNYVKKHKSLSTVVTATLFSSLAFFFVTNFAVWAFGSWYPKTFEGLQLAYFLAIPFFKNTLIGDFFYLSLMAGSFELLRSLEGKKFLKRITN